MQKRDSIYVNSSWFSNFRILRGGSKIRECYSMGHLSSSAVVSIDRLKPDESVRNSVQGGRNNVCFDVQFEIMTQNCLKSRHYQELFVNTGPGHLKKLIYQHILQNFSVDLLCVKN